MRHWRCLRKANLSSLERGTLSGLLLLSLRLAWRRLARKKVCLARLLGPAEGGHPAAQRSAGRGPAALTLLDVTLVVR